MVTSTQLSTMQQKQSVAGVYDAADQSICAHTSSCACFLYYCVMSVSILSVIVVTV